MQARGLQGEEQMDFLLSSLKGSALDEVKLRMGGQPKQLSDLFSSLAYHATAVACLLCPQAGGWGRFERLFTCPLPIT